MTRSTLTPRPRVPVLIQAAAVSTLVLAPVGCGDDGGGTSTVADSDQFPTAGPCYHNSGGAECETTGLTAMTATGSGSGSGSDTTATSGADVDTDVHPTAGPCAHDPDAPGCASSTGADGTSTDGSGSAGSSDSGGSSSSSGG